MITALTVRVPERRKGIRGFFDRFRQDKADVQVKRARGVYLKHITYISYSGKIKTERINEIVGAQRNHLLCLPSLKFPENSGYKRFYLPEFSARLCTNMALYVLSRCVNPTRLKIGVYDPNACECDFLHSLMEYVSDVVVVTEEAEKYRAVVDEIMDEQGASAMVTKQTDELCNCNMIIAPYAITEKLPISNEALVLTGEAPKEQTSGLVYYKYYFKMPNGFDRIKPSELDEEYFCSALYTLGRQYQLGSIVPSLCRNYSSSQTVKSLCAYLERFA